MQSDSPRSSDIDIKGRPTLFGLRRYIVHPNAVRVTNIKFAILRIRNNH